MRLQGPGVPAPGVAAAPVGAPMGSEANVMGKTPKGPDLVVSVARFGTLIPKQVKDYGTGRKVGFRQPKISQHSSQQILVSRNSQ